MKKRDTNLTEVQPFVHKGYDLVMYLASIGVMSNIDYALGFDDVMMKHSQFSAIGLCNIDHTIINPIVYAHVILSDEGAEEFKKYLKSGRSLVPISDIIEKGNIPALLHTLVEVKEENKDEQ